MTQKIWGMSFGLNHEIWEIHPIVWASLIYTLLPFYSTRGA